MVADKCIALFMLKAQEDQKFLRELFPDLETTESFQTADNRQPGWEVLARVWTTCLTSAGVDPAQLPDPETEASPKIEAKSPGLEEMKMFISALPEVINTRISRMFFSACYGDRGATATMDAQRAGVMTLSFSPLIGHRASETSTRTHKRGDYQLPECFLDRSYMWESAHQYTLSATCHKSKDRWGTVASSA